LMNKVFAPLRLLRAMFQALQILRQQKPQVVLGMGGFASGPGGLVSRILGIPLVIHEQNAIAGMTNRWLAKIAKRCLQAFPNAFDASINAQTMGNPVRADISVLADPDARCRGLAEKTPSAIRILVIGGSLGAQALNETLPLALALIDDENRPTVSHQAGRGKLDQTIAAYKVAGVEAQVTEFVKDMPSAYQAADLVICRAGALTISELAAVGVASILVPFPYAVDDHQTINGGFLVNAEAAILIQQKTLTAAMLADTIKSLCETPEKLLAMAIAARAQAKPDATKNVADICMEVAA